MIYKKLRIVRSFCSRSNWSNKGVFNVPRRTTALLLLGALSVSSVAHGQATGITVNALPYVLTNNGGVTVVTSYPVTPVPRAVGGSSFVSLFGGGFSAVLPNYSESLGAVIAITAVRKIAYMKAAQFAKKAVQQWEQDGRQAQTNLQTQTPSCGVNPNAVPANFTMVNHVSSRIRVRRMRNGFPKLAAAADTCELPEEEQAENAQEELEALNESETASQEALESAEEALAAAEVAAEAAEAAAEAALEAAEVLETILEACSLF